MSNSSKSPNTPQPSTELVVSDRPAPKPLIYFGGNTDRAPTKGYRRWLYEGHLPVIFNGLNLGQTNQEIIEVELEGCIRCREELGRIPGPLCVGFFGSKGGPGKSTMSTMCELMFHDMNPVYDKVILIDINTSMTNLDELNGLSKEDFLTGKYWTMETLYAYIVQQVGDVNDPEAFNAFMARLEFDDINAKLAYRKDPQLPIIPLLLDPSDFSSDENALTGEHYLVVLRVLKKHFTVIVHDFGTALRDNLTRVAFSQLHMLAVLTHGGIATTKMVANTLELLHLNYPELLPNSVVIYNMPDRPSRMAQRAILLERAGKKPKYEQLKSKLGGSGVDGKEIQTPGQALEVINDLIDVRKYIEPLEFKEIVMVGFDSHLKRESDLYLDQVSDAVQGHLWTVLHRMLRTRVEFERELLTNLPDELPEGVVVRRRARMTLEVPASMPIRARPKGFEVVQRREKGNSSLKLSVTSSPFPG